ncbi:MAG: hypothetical protein RR842_09825 [Gordonibacter sp.]|uniref:hypothetical protein n=1 Tax=Gordonibacter sp. TaxID=1968902 RepID=UPI002FC86A0D
MSAEGKARGWLSVADAARYASVAEQIIRVAVASGELPAYERPALRERDSALRRNMRVSIADVDTWVRDTWKPAEVGARVRDTRGPVEVVV